jgi:hypothetical protein
LRAAAGCVPGHACDCQHRSSPAHAVTATSAVPIRQLARWGRRCSHPRPRLQSPARQLGHCWGWHHWLLS